MIKKVTILLLCLIYMTNVQSQLSILPNEKYDNFHVEKVSIDYISLNKDAINKSLKSVSIEIFSEKHSLILRPVQIMSPELAKKYPTINTYKAYTKDGKINGRITIGSYGIYGQLFTEKGLVAINPDDHDKSKIHSVQIGKDPNFQVPACQAGNHTHSMADASDSYQYKTNEESNGSTKRIYTMAVVTTFEFYRVNGSSEEGATEAVVAAVNAISEVYENELAVNFTLLPPKIYTSEDDPFNPNQPRPEQANDAVFDNFDFDEFDIGHVLNASGGGWPGGGVTNLAILCDGSNANNSFKGGGWTGSYRRIDFDFVNTFAHEVGHMFGATHTWNGEGGSCNSAGQHPGINAFEIGSGSTIMSYNGLCGNQNTPKANQHFFHSSSIFKMVRNMKISRSRCVQLIEEESGNEAPQIDADPCDISTLKIPHSTPFLIQGQVSDDNGTDDLSYSWEQYDASANSQGFIGEEAANSTGAPLFRTFNPSSSPIRYFPEVFLTLNGRADDFQALPAVQRNMDFKLVGRDNHPGSGGVGIDGVTVRTSEFGPFEITSVNDRSFMLGDELIIEWETNGSEETCENLAILLSYNSGISFDFKLAEGIPYGDGQYSFTIPESVVTTTFAMLMLACDDNECIRFYDLYNAPVSFGTSCATKPSKFCDTTPIVADQGSENLDLELDVIINTDLVTSKTTSCGAPGFQNSTTEYTYIAVGQNDNIVRAASADADFRFLVSGDYNVYGVSYKAADPEPPAKLDPATWIGQNMDDVINRDFCAMKTNNFVPLEISGGGGLPCALTYDIGPTVPGFRTIRCLAPINYEENIRDNEAIVVENLVLTRKYTFTFCEGYDENIFEARVVVQEYNSETGEIGNVISDGTGCQHIVRLTAGSAYDDVIIIITDNNDCQTSSQNMENGIPEFKCAVGRNLDGEDDDTNNFNSNFDSAIPSQIPSASIFPNPARDEINIVVENVDTYSISITDLTGTLISTYANKAKIDITNLPNGLYLVNIQDEQSSIITVEKFVVLK